jgi:hypothetical protein
MSTGHRKVVLAVVVQPHHLVTLSVTCRTCSRCDLLIAHQADVAVLLTELFREHDPSVIGNDYAVAGTLDRAEWEQSIDPPLPLTQLAELVYPFAEVVAYERTVPAGEAPEGLPAEGATLEPERSERESVPRRWRALYDEIEGQTSAVCREHLNEEYALLCRRLAAALTRKRPSPLTRGRPASWACGIAYAIGSVNFLFDKSQTPHYKASELCAFFGVSPATGSARASEIRKLFGMYQFDPRWCLPSLMDENPYVWLIDVDGIPADARYAPRQVQEEALRRGLIPYLPETSMEW